MPENRKYYVNNSVHLITARTEEGLPIVPSLFLNLLIWGILARAKKLYRIKVCHFLFMGNHFHMIVVVEDPEHVSDFVGYVKGEIAHVINRLLGRRRKTIWAEGYDSPPLLDQQTVLRFIEYIYLNPIRANLVATIDEFPGVSSWEMFKSEVHLRECFKVSRDEIIPLHLPAMNINEQRELESFYREIGTSEEFVLEPNAWMQCFGLKEEDAQQFRESTLKGIKEQSDEESKANLRKNKLPLGATTLRRQSMLKEHAPKKFSKRMICIGACKDMRKVYIEHYRFLCELASKAFKAWKSGDFRLKIPPGLFAPRVPSLASVILYSS